MGRDIDIREGPDVGDAGDISTPGSGREEKGTGGGYRPEIGEDELTRPDLIPVDVSREEDVRRRQEEVTRRVPIDEILRDQTPPRGTGNIGGNRPGKS